MSEKKQRKLLTDVEQISAQVLALQEVRLQMRAQRPLWQRLRAASDKAKVLSTVPSAGISEYTTHGKTEGSEPPQQQIVDITDRMALVAHAIEMLEEAVDAECGLSPARAFNTKRTEDLDKELLKWRGVPSFVVAVKAPWLGRIPTDHRAGASADGCPTVRRARVDGRAAQEGRVSVLQSQSWHPPREDYHSRCWEWCAFARSARPFSPLWRFLMPKHTQRIVGCRWAHSDRIRRWPAPRRAAVAATTRRRRTRRSARSSPVSAPSGAHSISSARWSRCPMMPPILLTLIYLLSRRWPRWMVARAGIPPARGCHLGSRQPCRERWCQLRHW
jgi:hypothetical protein